MVSGDGWSLCSRYLSDSWGKTSKNLNQENWPDWGSNPGPLGERQRCYLSTTEVVGDEMECHFFGNKCHSFIHYLILISLL